MDWLKSIWTGIKKYSFIFTKFISRKLANWVERREKQNQPKELTFADKKVSQVMLPANDIKWVAASEPISPAVMDELHKTSQCRFALVKYANTANQEIVGTLYIGELLKHLNKDAKLRDLMQSGVEFIKENQNLEQALAKCLQTSGLLLMVNDNHGELVGQISIEQILEQALGKLPEAN